MPLTLIIVSNFQITFEQNVLASTLSINQNFDFSSQKSLNTNDKLISVINFEPELKIFKSQTLTENMFFFTEITNNNFAKLCNTSKCFQVQLFILPTSLFQNNNGFYYFPQNNSFLNSFSLYAEQTRTNDSFESYTKITTLTNGFSFINLNLIEKLKEFNIYPTNNAVFLSNNFASEQFKSALIGSSYYNYNEFRTDAIFNLYITYNRQILINTHSIGQSIDIVQNYENNIRENFNLFSINHILLNELLNAKKIVSSFNENYILFLSPLWSLSFITILLIQKESLNPINDFLAKILKIGFDQNDILNILIERLFIIDITGLFSIALLLFIGQIFNFLELNLSSFLIILAESLFINFLIQFITLNLDFINLSKKIFPKEYEIKRNFNFKISRYSSKITVFCSILIFCGFIFILFYFNNLLRPYFIFFLSIFYPIILGVLTLILLTLTLKFILKKIFNSNFSFCMVEKGIKSFEKNNKQYIWFKDFVIVLMILVIVISSSVSAIDNSTRDKAVLGQAFGYQSNTTNFANISNSFLSKFEGLKIHIFNSIVYYGFFNYINVTYFVLDSKDVPLFNYIINSDMNFNENTGQNLTSLLLKNEGNAIISSSVSKSLNVKKGDLLNIPFSPYYGDINPNDTLNNKIVFITHFIDLFSIINQNWVLTCSFSPNKNNSINYQMSIIILGNITKSEISSFEESTQIKLITKNDIPTLVNNYFYDKRIFNDFTYFIILFLLLVYIVIFSFISQKYHSYFCKFNNIWNIRGGTASFRKNLALYYSLWFNFTNKKTFMLLYIPIIAFLLILNILSTIQFKNLNLALVTIIIIVLFNLITYIMNKGKN